MGVGQAKNRKTCSSPSKILLVAVWLVVGVAASFGRGQCMGAGMEGIISDATENNKRAMAGVSAR